MNNISPEILAAVGKAQQAWHEAKSTGKLNLSEVYDYRREQKVKKQADLLEKCGIATRYRECTFATIEAYGVPPAAQNHFQTMKEYAADIEGHLQTGTGLILRGRVGTMKTTLAVAVLQAVLALGKTGFLITMPSLLDTIFTMKEKNTDEWLAFETNLRQTPLLVLDDLGAEYASAWVLNKVDAIITERYNRRRSMIITTNLTSDQMRNTYTERLIDRLRSTCQVLTFAGQSLRPTAERAG